MQYTISNNTAGARLDVFLAEHTNQSRSQWQKAIKAGAVTVNGGATTPHYALREHDVVATTAANAAPATAPATAPLQKPAVLPKTLFPTIVFENDDYLVINKPAGLTVHGGAGITGPTLVDWLTQAYPAIADVGEDPLRPGLVHRLDKEASGLMVIAKTNQAFKWFKRQFKERETYKEYSALVYGSPSKDHDTITFPIARSAQGFKMAAVPDAARATTGRTAREAITEFDVQKRFINHTFIRAVIKTGRTHQIRVHCAAYGHPLVGDDLYGTKKTRTLNAKLGLGRIFLHATKLAFTDLDHQQVAYESALPAKLNEVLQQVT